MSHPVPILAQLRRHAVLPALHLLTLDSPAARNLVLGTAAVETGGAAIAQIDGPALSYWQIEKATAMDAFERLHGQSLPRWRVMCGLMLPEAPFFEQLAFNALYAAAMCRVIYFLAPEPLPAADDVVALGQYWKTHYNTRDGAGTVADFVRAFETLIGDVPDTGTEPTP